MALPQGICSPLHGASVIPWSTRNSVRGTCPCRQHLQHTVVLPLGTHRDPVVLGDQVLPLVLVSGNQATSHGREGKTATGGFWPVLAPAWRRRMNPSCLRDWGGPGWARVSFQDPAGCQGGVHCPLRALSAAQSAAFPCPVISGQGLCCATTFEMIRARPTAPGAQLPPKVRAPIPGTPRVRSLTPLLVVLGSDRVLPHSHMHGGGLCPCCHRVSQRCCPDLLSPWQSDGSAVGPAGAGGLASCRRSSDGDSGLGAQRLHGRQAPQNRAWP